MKTNNLKDKDIESLLQEMTSLVAELQENADQNEAGFNEVMFYASMYEIFLNKTLNDFRKGLVTPNKQKSIKGPIESIISFCNDLKQYFKELKIA